MYWKDFFPVSEDLLVQIMKDHGDCWDQSVNLLKSRKIENMRCIEGNGSGYTICGIVDGHDIQMDFNLYRDGLHMYMSCGKCYYRDCPQRYALLLAYDAFFHYVVMPQQLIAPSGRVDRSKKIIIQQMMMNVLNDYLKDFSKREEPIRAEVLRLEKEAEERERLRKEKLEKEQKERERKRNEENVNNFFSLIKQDGYQDVLDEIDEQTSVRKVHLTPVLDMSSPKDGFDLSFSIRYSTPEEAEGREVEMISNEKGYPKSYVVKDIVSLLSALHNGSTLDFGKDLKFKATPDCLDEMSKSLFSTLCSIFGECQQYSEPSNYQGEYRSIKLTNYALDVMFDFLQSYPGRAERTEKRHYPLATAERPIFTITVKTEDNGKSYKLECGQADSFFSGFVYTNYYMEYAEKLKRLRSRPLYCVAVYNHPMIGIYHTLKRYPPEEGAQLRPLIRALRDGGGSFTVTREQWKKLRTEILPPLQGSVRFVLPQGETLEEVVHRSMKGLFLLDAKDKNTLLLTPLADYDGVIVNTLTGKVAGKRNPQEKSTTPILWSSKVQFPNESRSVPDEKRLMIKACSLLGMDRSSIVALLENPPKEDSLEIDGNDDLYRILTEGLSKLKEWGEVLVSDKVRSMSIIPPKQVSVGVSLSNGLLTVNVDTGVPLEEYMDILRAYREKRRYYRMKDGSFVNFSDMEENVAQSWQQLEELQQGLQMDKLENEFKVPAFRAMYLDGLFNEENGIEAKKSKSFNQLIRKIQGFADAKYELPAGFDSILRSYQKTGFQWLKTLESCSFGGILADDMGLGKSVQLISFLADYYAHAENPLPSLIVSPASLVLNWKAELEKFAPKLPVRIIMGTASVREKLISEIQPNEIVLSSYDLLKRDIARYEGQEFYCFTIDEAQYIKNHTTQAARAVKGIVCRQRFALTGTPIENRLSELWSIFDFLMPGYLYKYTRFKSQFESPIAKDQDETARENLRRMVRPFVLRRLKGDVLTELPARISTVIPVEIEGKQRELYDATLYTGLKNLKLDPKAPEATSRMKVLALLTRLRRLCCDPSLCFEDYQGDSAKPDACMELIHQAADGSHRVLLFSQYTDMLDVLERRLREEDISFLRLQGSTPAGERLKLVERFNGGEGEVFLISLKAGGTGLNLVGADTVILYDPWWNNAAQEQAADRAHRIGQKKVVHVYKLIAQKTIEEKILELQEKKKGLSEVIESGDSEEDSVLTKMSPDEIISLLKEH